MLKYRLSHFYVICYKLEIEAHWKLLQEEYFSHCYPKTEVLMFHHVSKLKIRTKAPGMPIVSKWTLLLKHLSTDTLQRQEWVSTLYFSYVSCLISGFYPAKSVTQLKLQSSELLRNPAADHFYYGSHHHQSLDFIKANSCVASYVYLPMKTVLSQKGLNAKHSCIVRSKTQFNFINNSQFSII